MLPTVGRPIASTRAWFVRLRRFSRDARLYLAGAGLMGLGHGAAWVHLNLWYRSVGLDERAIGSLLAIASVGAVAVAIPAGVWVDRVPAGRVLALAAAGFAVTLVAPLFMPVMPVMAVAALLQGGFFMVHWIAAAPFFMRTALPEDRPDLFGLAHAVETVATLLAALGVGVLASWGHGWLGSERRGLELGLVVAAMLALLAVPVLAAIRIRPQPGPSRDWRAQLQARDWRLLAKLVIPASLVGCGAGFVIPFMNLYFRNRFGQDPASIGAIFASGQVITTFAFLIGPALARRIGAVRAIVLTELASIPFFLLLAFATTLPVAVVAFWLRGALMQMNQPIASAFTLEQVPPDQQAVTNSVRHVGWNVAWAVSTQVGGAWIARDGFAPPMLATACLYVTASALFWWFFGRRPAPVTQAAEAVT